MTETTNNHPGQEGHHAPDAQPVLGTNEAQEPQPLKTHMHDPRILEDLHIPICLETVLDMGSSASGHAAKARVDRLLETAKQADDPIERMILEQLCLAHHHIAALHARAAKSSDIKAVTAYQSAAQRLLGEWRRLVHELREHRTPLQGKQTTVVHKVEQWNQAEHQDVAFAKTEGPEEGSRMECRDSELGSKRGTGDHDALHDNRRQRLEESQASSGWSS